MKQVRWTAHAEASLRDRDIPRVEAELTLQSADRRSASRGLRVVLARRYEDRVLGQPMALCVVVEEHKEETVVVTVYKSSKLDKYLTGGAE